MAALPDSLTAAVAGASVAATGRVGLPTAGPVDLDAALARLGGNLGLYRQVFRMFRVDAGSMIAVLADLVATGQRQEAGRVSHTLKGLAATLGATKLATAAQHAEAAMAQEPSDADAGLLADAGAAFGQACLGIEQALTAVSGSPCPGHESSGGT